MNITFRRGRSLVNNGPPATKARTPPARGVPSNTSPIRNCLSPRRLCRGVLALSLTAFSLSTQAVIPSPERLLPDDTLILVTAPDFAKVRDHWSKSLQSQFWSDPAMRPFRDKLTSKLSEDLVKPLERDLGIKFADYSGLFQGQITFALRQIAATSGDSGEAGVLLLVDAREKTDQLRQNLADLRKKWLDAGKTMRTEKIHDLEFSILGLSSNEIGRAHV